MTTGLLLVLVAALVAAEEPPVLDSATIDRAEAAADAFLAGEDTPDPAIAALPPHPEAVALDEDQREALTRAGVALLEAETHLGIGQGSEAGDRFLEAHALLQGLPPAAVAPRTQAELARCRQRLTALGRRLLEGGHVAVPSSEDTGEQGLESGEPAPPE